MLSRYCYPVARCDTALWLPWEITQVLTRILSAHLCVSVVVKLRRRERQQPQENCPVLLRHEWRRAEPRAQVHRDCCGAAG